MSYLRPIRKSELVEFLQENFDVPVEELAQIMINKFDILTPSNTPT